MSSTFENIIECLKYDILGSNEIAEIAEIDYSDWQRHVFYGLTGFTMQKNKGRLPYIEFELLSNDFDDRVNDGGFENNSLRIRINYGRKNFYNNKLESQKKIQKIMRAILSGLKENHLTKIQDGNYNLSEIISMPWGFYQELDVNIRTTYDNNNYGDHDV